MPKSGFVTWVYIYIYAAFFTLKRFSDAILKLAGFYTFWSSGSVKLQNTWPLVAPEKCCPWSCLISAGSKWSCTGERRRGADLKKANKKRGLRQWYSWTSIKRPPYIKWTVIKVSKYCKIPKISPRAYIFQRPFLRGLFLEGLVFRGAYLQREICVSKSIGLALLLEVNLPFLLCFTLYLRAIFQVQAPGGLIFGGAHFRNLQ